MVSYLDSGKRNEAYLCINSDNLQETLHYTRSSTDWGRSTGGRVVILETSAGDTIELRTNMISGDFHRIYFCAEYISKM